ncbi:MAG: hypothetical protein ACREQQ_09820, partial [Candidatus Binatia bacterium]
MVGLSKPRQERTFSGRALDDRLREKDAEARCALWVLDLKSGVVAVSHLLRFRPYNSSMNTTRDVRLIPEAFGPLQGVRIVSTGALIAQPFAAALAAE